MTIEHMIATIFWIGMLSCFLQWYAGYQFNKLRRTVMGQAQSTQRAEASTAWVELGELPPGMIFCTEDGVLAVKSEYHYTNGDQCQCILLESGEYGHFKDKDRTLVRPIFLAVEG